MIYTAVSRLYLWLHLDDVHCGATSSQCTCKAMIIMNIFWSNSDFLNKNWSIDIIIIISNSIIIVEYDLKIITHMYNNIIIVAYSWPLNQVPVTGQIVLFLPHFR